MKGLMIIVFMCLIMGCSSNDDDCDRGAMPLPPYGTPDSQNFYYGVDEWQSVQYTYWNYNGQYISVDYVSYDECSEWQLGSTFTGDPIE